MRKKSLALGATLTTTNPWHCVITKLQHKVPNKHLSAFCRPLSMQKPTTLCIAYIVNNSRRDGLRSTHNPRNLALWHHVSASLHAYNNRAYTNNIHSANVVNTIITNVFTTQTSPGYSQGKRVEQRKPIVSDRNNAR